MNLQKLFETQKKLDDKIVKEKGLEGQDLLDKKILALQVELGELANEWRGFKFWSENQEPNVKCPTCKGNGYDTFLGVTQRDTPCCRCNGYPENVNPLLEEYVDCLHFILSIGNDLGINEVNVAEMGDYTEEDTTQTFTNLFFTTGELPLYFGTGKLIDERYKILFAMLVGLGELHLEFTWNQIEQAYYDKNKVNHERQNNGY